MKTVKIIKTMNVYRHIVSVEHRKNEPNYTCIRWQTFESGPDRKFRNSIRNLFIPLRKTELRLIIAALQDALKEAEEKDGNKVCNPSRND